MMEVNVTTGVMMDLPTYNRLRSVERFYDSGPKGPRVVVTLVYHAQQSGLVVPSDTTFAQLTACLNILAGKNIYAGLKGQDGVHYEPSRTLAQERIEDGFHLFGILRIERPDGDKSQ